MGTVVRIEAYFPPAASPPAAFRTAFDRIAYLEDIFSSYREDSELRRVESRSWRERVLVSPEFAHVLGRALRFARESGGAFDPTVGRVTRLIRTPGWGLDGPDDRALREAWRSTGWKHVRMDTKARTVRITRRGLQFDLGGIAKGYIADEALAALERKGVERAMIAVAGDIVAGDPPPGQAGWRVGIDRSGPRGSIERFVLLSRQAVSTSGDRERFFLSNGRRCSHIITRANGSCADSRAAVSVVAPSGLMADGLATASAALGPKAAASMLAKYPAATAYWQSGHLQESPAVH